MVKIFTSLKHCNVPECVIYIQYTKEKVLKRLWRPEHQINEKGRRLLFLLTFSMEQVWKAFLWQYFKEMIRRHLVLNE